MNYNNFVGRTAAMRFSFPLLIIFAFMFSGIAHATLTAQIQACANPASGPGCSNYVSVNASGNWYIDVNQTIVFQGSATGGNLGCYEANSPYEMYSSCRP